MQTNTLGVSVKQSNLSKTSEEELILVSSLGLHVFTLIEEGKKQKRNNGEKCRTEGRKQIKVRDSLKKKQYE